MLDTIAASKLTEQVRSGSVSAIARMISRVEAGAPGAADQMAELYRAGGHAWVVGVTGVPGSGKSTLVGGITRALRAQGKTVGIVAVDPSSPYSGGSILGDRIRLTDLSSDDGVFIRSMASRGALGGIARATADAVSVLDAAGKDVVLIETVGVGQDEVEIATASHTTLVVSVPGLGDQIQALKAGVTEIADIHVVNKADCEGADRTAAELKVLLRLGPPGSPTSWCPPVLKVVAARDEGVLTVVHMIDQHRAWLIESGQLEVRDRDMAARRVMTIASQLLHDELTNPSRGADFEALVAEVTLRRLDPFNAAYRLLHHLD